MRIAKVLALTLAMGFAPGAGAIPWTEVGDAGDLPATAQVPTGSGALSSIFGSIPSAGAADADMYRIHISTPSTFSATTVGTVGLAGTQLENTELFLFNAAGIGVYGRDDDPGTARTTLPAGSLLGPLVPGDYFLAISGFARVEEAASRGNYRIDLTGAEFASIAAPVPEPGTLLLLAAGLFAILALRRCRFF